ncbi:MAG: hypothetical protein AB7N54_10780 [Alphaproteobacteria bacterium]
MRCTPDRNCFSLRLLFPRVAVFFVLALLVLSGAGTGPGLDGPVAEAPRLDGQSLSAFPRPDHHTLRSEAQPVAVSISRRSLVRAPAAQVDVPPLLAAADASPPTMAIDARVAPLRDGDTAGRPVAFRHDPRAPPSRIT